MRHHGKNWIISTELILNPTYLKYLLLMVAYWIEQCQRSIRRHHPTHLLLERTALSDSLVFLRQVVNILLGTWRLHPSLCCYNLIDVIPISCQCEISLNKIVKFFNQLYLLNKLACDRVEFHLRLLPIANRQIPVHLRHGPQYGPAEFHPPFHYT
jgi:hypothetical protein